MLEQIFLKVLDMSRTAGMIIVVVCIARIFLRRFPKCISYMLWSVVLFRLLCPATLELGISLVPSLEPVLYEYAAEKGGAPAEQADKAAVADTGSRAKESQGKAEGQEKQEKSGSGPTAPMESLPERCQGRGAFLAGDVPLIWKICVDIRGRHHAPVFSGIHCQNPQQGSGIHSPEGEYLYRRRKDVPFRHGHHKAQNIPAGGPKREGAGIHRPA